jgi:hypothetical protein
MSIEKEGAVHMSTPGKGLLDEISLLLRQFRKIKTPKSTKKVKYKSKSNLSLQNAQKEIFKSLKAKYVHIK